MRVLAIDYGDARTGIAISDASGSIVGRTTVIHSRRPQQTAEAIAALVQESGAERLVMGFPRNMDGTEGPRAEKSRAFAELLRERTGLEVRLWDERRSSVEAHAILSANGKREKKHKKTVDALAAALIVFLHPEKRKARLRLTGRLPLRLACLGAGLACLYYRVMSFRQFGGVTGDLAGYFLQLCELFMVLAAAVCHLAIS